MNNCTKYSLNFDISELFNYEVNYFLTSQNENDTENGDKNNLLTKELQKKLILNCELIQKKFCEILTESFRHLVFNFYSNKRNFKNLTRPPSENNLNFNRYTLIFFIKYNLQID